MTISRCNSTRSTYSKRIETGIGKYDALSQELRYWRHDRLGDILEYVQSFKQLWIRRPASEREPTDCVTSPHTGDWYDLAIDAEYLKPHGARRRLGHELYSKGRAEDAQSALRHKSIETTHSAYSDIQAGETAGRIDEVMVNEKRLDALLPLKLRTREQVNADEI